MRRYAVVTGARGTNEVAAYLPNNYNVVAWVKDEAEPGRCVITGEDSHGWTLTDYVIPRLGSGSMGCEAVPEDHPTVVSAYEQAITASLHAKP